MQAASGAKTLVNSFTILLPLFGPTASALAEAGPEDQDFGVERRALVEIPAKGGLEMVRDAGALYL
jgi:hypothetical protein